MLIRRHFSDPHRIQSISRKLIPRASRLCEVVIQAFLIKYTIYCSFKHSCYDWDYVYSSIIRVFLFGRRLLVSFHVILRNLKQGRFRCDGDLAGRRRLGLRQPSLPAKIRTLRLNQSRPFQILLGNVLATFRILSNFLSESNLQELFGKLVLFW